MKRTKRTISGRVEAQTPARGLRTPLTLDQMYRAVRALEDDRDDLIRKRLQKLTGELGEGSCALLDKLLDRGLEGEALEYIQLDNARPCRQREILNLLSTEFNWSRVLGGGLTHA